MPTDHPTPSAARKAESTTGPSVVRESGVRRGTVIAVFGPRGDVGVSTIASALAAALLSLDLGRIALAELDPRVLRRRAAATPEPVVAPPATSNGRGDEAADFVSVPGIDAGMTRRSDGLWTLVPGRRRTPVLSDAKSITVALEALRSAFDVSVAELEHQLNERTLAAFDAADRIVMVTEGSVPSLRGMQRVLRLCRRLNYPDEKMCVVVNRHDAPTSLAIADIATILKREVYWKVPLTEQVDATELAVRLAAPV